MGVFQSGVRYFFLDCSPLKSCFFCPPNISVSDFWTPLGNINIYAYFGTFLEDFCPYHGEVFLCPSFSAYFSSGTPLRLFIFCGLPTPENSSFLETTATPEKRGILDPLQPLKSQTDSPPCPERTPLSSVEWTGEDLFWNGPNCARC